MKSDVRLGNRYDTCTRTLKIHVGSDNAEKYMYHIFQTRPKAWISLVIILMQNSFNNTNSNIS